MIVPNVDTLCLDFGLRPKQQKRKPFKIEPGSVARDECQESGKILRARLTQSQAHSDFKLCVSFIQ